MSLGLKKSALTRTIKASRKLPAGAGKFPPVTRGNRRQSVPAEIFACIRGYFYLRNRIPAAIAGNFARASFTVNFFNWSLLVYSYKYRTVILNSKWPRAKIKPRKLLFVNKEFWATHWNVYVFGNCLVWQNMAAMAWFCHDHGEIWTWSCHDNGMAAMFLSMVIMIHGMIMVWIPCFP